MQEKSATFKSLNHPDDKSFIPTTSSVEVVHDQLQISSKPIIKPWEEIHNNKNRRGLGYVSDDTHLQIPDYSKPIKFVSAGFLEPLTSAGSEKVVDKQHCTQREVDVQPKCSHCQRTGHMEDQCFDLHPCCHCGKYNHSSAKCRNQHKSGRLKIHYAWIDPWEWSSTVKRLSQFYNRLHSHIMQPAVNR